MVDYDVVSRDKAAHIINGSRRPEYEYLISIADITRDQPRRVPGYKNFHPMRRLLLNFDDVTTDSAARNGYQRATREQVEAVVKFCRRVTGKTLIHCEAGISRSSACAIILGAVQLGPGGEMEAVGTLFEKGKPKRVLYHDQLTDQQSKAFSNQFFPNHWVVRLADHILKRDGRLNDALAHFYPYAKDTRNLDVLV